MSISVNIPKLGMSMVAADMVEWKASEGDRVEKGSVVLAIETEKISWDVEAPATGFLHIVVPNGKTVKVGTEVGVITETMEECEGLAADVPKQTDVPGRISAGPSTSRPVISSPAARRLAAELGVDLTSLKGSGPDGRITEKDVAEATVIVKATPVARKMAAQEGLDLATVKGTRERGKITKQDVEQALNSRTSREELNNPGPSGVRVVPMIGMRKAIADNMFASIHNTAQVTVFAEVDVTDSLSFLRSVQDTYGKDGALKVSFTDILVMAVARSLKRVPIINSNLTEDGIVIFDAVHVGIAVAVPEGLIVPVLRNACRKGLLEIARETRELAGKAREGRLGIEDITGGTFTISNVSMFEIDGSTPILKHPDTGILAAGRVRQKPAVHNGEICVRSMMFLSLTFDHRVVDGAQVGEFMGHLGTFLGSPNLMLA